MNCIENLSNELFYEIFEYLDGCDIYKAFSNLNFRFQRLITCSSFLLKIKLRSEAESAVGHDCKNVIIPNRHRILSLYVENESLIRDFFTHCMIDSSFSRLESVVLGSISSDQLIILLFYLKSLPRLFSLTIDHDEEEWGYNLSTLYRMIFSMPYLQYNKLSVSSMDPDEELDILVPLASNEQFSSIQHLIIDHNITIHEILSVLHHTPRLSHLTCTNLIDSLSPVDIKNLPMLSHLIYLGIDNCQIDFHDFEIFITKVSSQLRVLNVTQYMTVAYLDADRWERLIKKHIPHLRRFYYKYQEYFELEEEESIDLCMKIKQFTSRFWIERQCFAKVEISYHETSYSIQSYR
jgi:hypothetical protein